MVDRQQIHQLHTGTHVACTLSFVLGSCELSRNGRYNFGTQTSQGRFARGVTSAVAGDLGWDGSVKLNEHTAQLRSAQARMERCWAVSTLFHSHYS